MKAVVLLSAGLDSSVNLYKAHEELEEVLALNFNYGQRAAMAERRSARQLCESLSIELLEIDLDFFKHFNSSSLTNTGKSLSLDVDIYDPSESLKSAKNVWVPNRNGIFLNIAAAIAEKREYDFVIPGFNIEEASTFLDNSTGFMEALDTSFSYSTSNKVRTVCYTSSMDKKQIVQMGKQLGLDFDSIWPCYQNLEKLCGRCESCLRFKNAME